MKGDTEIRNIIVELHLSGMDNSEIRKMLGPNQVTKKLVWMTVKRYKETGTAEDRPRSGRPTTKRIPEMIKKVRERIRCEPNCSMRKMAKEMGMSHTSMQNISSVQSPRPSMATTLVYCGGIFRDEVNIVDRFPKDGETVLSQDYFRGFGGKSANQSVAASLLREKGDGMEIYFMGRVGCNANGHEYVSHLKGKMGINTDFLLRTSEKPTGIASIALESSTGENKIMVYKGANDLFNEEDVKKTFTAMSSLKNSVSWVVVGTEIYWGSVLATLDHAVNQLGAMTLLNFAPIPDNFHGVDSLLKNVSILCVNQVEANALSGDQDYQTSMDKLLSHVPMVIITLGAQGAVFKSRKSSQAVSVSIPEVHKPSVIVDTTGAGDAFIGSLSYYLGVYAASQGSKRHLPSDSQMEEMILRSCIIAAYSITRKGTQSSYFPRNSLPKDLFSII